MIILNGTRSKNTTVEIIGNGDLMVGTDTLPEKTRARWVNGAICWVISETDIRVLDLSICREIGLDQHPSFQKHVQQSEYRKYVDLTLGEYIAANKNREHTPEELYEMRAAFGPGTTVVNVITGKRTKL